MESCSTSSIFNKQTASFSRGHSQKSARNYLWPLCRWKAAFHLQILRFFGLLISCGWSFLGRNATLRPPIRLLIHPSRLVFHPLITPHTNYNTYAMYLSGILHSEESIVGIKLKLVEYQCRKLINNAWHTCCFKYSMLREPWDHMVVPAVTQCAVLTKFTFYFKSLAHLVPLHFLRGIQP